MTILAGLITLTIIYLVILFLIPDKVELFIEKFSFLPYFELPIICLSFFVVLLYLLTNIFKWFQRNGSIQEVKIFDKTTIKNEQSKEESIFNKNMDEIVYFFEATKTEIVIIEDLDRFNSTNIFVALRELNYILNHYENIAGKVKFIYAIKDDMFEKQGERTKFFDFIIPIVPYISSTNSVEILRKELQFDEVENRSKIYKISGKFISLISSYISDMRELICICNEFNIFKNTLKGNQKTELKLDDERLFALIVFKNLYPKDFADLEDEKEESIVRIAFQNKKTLVESKEELLDKKQQVEVEKLEKIKNESLKSIQEIKLILINSLVDFNSAVYKFYDGSGTYNISDFLQDSYDLDVFKEKEITVYWESKNQSGSKTINNIEKAVKEKGNYFDRLDNIKKGLEKCEEESRQNIEEYEKKINDLRAYTICNIIKDFGTDFLGEKVKDNKLLVFLLRNGYLDENYENYINYFHPNSINKEEMNFILGIRNYDSEFDYSYTIKNKEQVFQRLLDYEFKQKEVLNYDLVDYVLEKKIDTRSAKMLIEQLSNHTVESMAFIKAYVNRENNIDRLFYYLCKKNNLFWTDITNDDGISLETRYHYLVLLLQYADIDDVIAQDRMSDDTEGILTEFMLSYPDILKKINSAPVDKQIELIGRLGIVLSDVELDGIDDRICAEVFDSCRYELNIIMLQRLFDWKMPEHSFELQNKNYTSILSLNYQPLIDYVHDYFTEYISNVVLDVSTNEQEEIEALEDIIERLLPENEELCFEVLQKEKVVWDNIELCCKGLDEEAVQCKKKIWEFLLNNNRIKCTWENYSAYYEQYGSDKCWAEYFDKNKDVLLDDIDESIVTEKMLSDLLLSDITDDSLKMLISKVDLKPYNDSLTKLSKTKIKIMLDNNLLPYNESFWVEMADVANEYRVFYAEKNSSAFITSLDSIELTVDEINELIQSDKFTPDEKNDILSKINVSNMGLETAKIIKELNFIIDRKYADAAWDLLEETDKYVLLLNQLDAYENEELPDMFKELAQDYQQLCERTRHKFTFTYSDYNKKLLDKLEQKNYINHPNEEWIGKDDGRLFSLDKQHIITGYVKQSKEG